MRIGELVACGASGVGRMNLGGVLCTSALLQAGLVEYRRQNPNTYHTVNKLLMATTVINGLGILWATGKTVDGLKKHFDISLFSERIRTGQWVFPDWNYGKIFRVNSSILSSLIATFGTATLANMVLRNEATTLREGTLRQLVILQMITMLPHVRSLQNCATLLGLGGALASSTITPFVKQRIYQGEHPILGWYPAVPFEEGMDRHVFREENIGTELFFYGIGNPQNIEPLRAAAGDIAKVACFSYAGHEIDKVFREYCL